MKGLFILFLSVCLGYLVLAYALRWYEITNQPEYYAKYGERTAAKVGWYALLLFAQEYFYTVAHLLLLAGDYLLIPYYYWRYGQSRLIKGNTGCRQNNPLILVHGYMMRGGSLWGLKRRLQRDQRQVWLFNYSPPTQAISCFSQQLKEAVELVLAETNKTKVDLIGHSMGGLVILNYLAFLGGDTRVNKVITLGTPYHGSKLWALSLGNCGLQMRPHHELLQKLRESGVNEKVKFTAIYSEFDELVLPAENARWDAPGVNNIPVSGFGHVGITFVKPVYDLIDQALKESPGQPAQDILDE
ncbi:MAG: alpha/beta fold hydrolase [Candidatus Schekmanbacteria bacterium]|nr:alpha/beta fold hydrolase [Candidatus Schekmanbacteria bacterium]